MHAGGGINDCGEKRNLQKLVRGSRCQVRARDCPARTSGGRHTLHAETPVLFQFMLKKHGQGSRMEGPSQLQDGSVVQMYQDRSIRSPLLFSILLILCDLQMACGLRVTPTAFSGRLVQPGCGGHPAILFTRSFQTRIVCGGSQRLSLASAPASFAPAAPRRAQRRREAHIHVLDATSSEVADSQPDKDEDVEEDDQGVFCTPPQWIRNPLAQGVALVSFYAFHVFVLCRQTVDVPLALLRPLMSRVPEMVTLSWEVVFGTAIVFGYLTLSGAAGRTEISKFLSGLSFSLSLSLSLSLSKNSERLGISLTTKLEVELNHKHT